MTTQRSGILPFDEWLLVNPSSCVDASWQASRAPGDGTDQAGARRERTDPGAAEAVAVQGGGERIGNLPEWAASIFTLTTGAAREEPFQLCARVSASTTLRPAARAVAPDAPSPPTVTT